MRLYLSSYRLGNHIDQLLKLVGPGRRVAIIENALDYIPAADQQVYKQQKYNIFEVFEALGFEPYPLDLRIYFPQNKDITPVLEDFDLIWAIGGNAFLLNRAMYQSGFDKALTKLLDADKVAYGGWSAGICVMAPTLRGIDLCDKPEQIVEGYQIDIRWEGLGIVDSVLVPHYRSDHPEAHMMEEVVAFLDKEVIPYKTLRDGDVWIFEGNTAKIFPYEKGEDSPLNLNKAMV